MTENNINAYCSICGEGYHLCSTCQNTKSFKPWRTVTDTIAHYKIYMAIHGYTISKDKKEAKRQLETCDLSGLDNFKPEIKSVIKEILKEPDKEEIKKQGNILKSKKNKTIKEPDSRLSEVVEKTNE